MTGTHDLVSHLPLNTRVRHPEIEAAQEFRPVDRSLTPNPVVLPNESVDLCCLAGQEDLPDLDPSAYGG